MATRATSIAELTERFAHFTTDDGVARGLSYRPAPTDVFISPYAKCGTTWVQQIVHGLRTGGSMAFSEITEVVPWIELAHDMGMDAHAPQVAHPKAFKSHLNWHDIPKGGRYINVFRDPLDAMVSFFHFHEGWWFETGTISLPDFAAFYLDRAGGRDYWTHTASWWAQRGRDDVLCLTFEGLKSDLAGCVTQIADFIGIIDAAHRQIAARQATFDFMKAHATQFDDHLVRQTRDAACGLPPGGASDKVSRGMVGGGAAQLTPDIHAAFDARWHETMTLPFGLESYGDLQRALTG